MHIRRIISDESSLRFRLTTCENKKVSVSCFHNSLFGDLVQIPVRFKLLKALRQGKAGLKVLQLAELDGFLKVPVDEVKRHQASF